MTQAHDPKQLEKYFAQATDEPERSECQGDSHCEALFFDESVVDLHGFYTSEKDGFL